MFKCQLLELFKKREKNSVLIINNSKIVFRNLKILTKSSSIKMVDIIGWFYAPVFLVGVIEISRMVLKEPGKEGRFS